VPVFRNSTHFFDLQVIFCSQMTLTIHKILFKLFVVYSLPLLGRYFCKQRSPFWLDNRDEQERNAFRWRLVQETSLAPPCLNLRSFGSKCSVLKKVLMTLLWHYAPRSDSAPGESCPLPPLLRPWRCAIKIGKFPDVYCYGARDRKVIELSL